MDVNSYSAYVKLKISPPTTFFWSDASDFNKLEKSVFFCELSRYGPEKNRNRNDKSSFNVFKADTFTKKKINSNL